MPLPENVETRWLNNWRLLSEVVPGQPGDVLAWDDELGLWVPDPTLDGLAQTVADLDEAVAALGARQVGHQIAEGTVSSGTSFDITGINSSLRWLRLRLVGQISGSTPREVFVRINGDTSSIYRGGAVRWRASDGAVVSSNHSTTNDGMRIGELRNELSCSIVCDILVPATGSQLISWNAVGTVTSATNSSHLHTQAGGSITSGSSIASLTVRIRGDGFVALRYSLEGLG